MKFLVGNVRRRYEKMMNYREYTITEHGSGYTVFYMGEEIFFDTLDGAKMFIDELCEEY